MSLKGSLETVGLAEVLRFLASTGKSGEFHLAGMGGGEGRLWFDVGSISGFEAGESRAPFEAIFELLRFDGGEFDFAPDVARPYHIEQVSGEDREVEPAVQRAQQRLEEWRSIVSDVPSLAHRVYLSTDLPCEEVTLNKAEWSVIGAIGAGRAVGDLLSERGLREFEGCKVIKEMVDAHLVTVEQAPPVPAALEESVGSIGAVGFFGASGIYAGEEPFLDELEDRATDQEVPDPAPGGRMALEALAAEAADYGYEYASEEPPDDAFDPDAVLTDPYIVGDAQESYDADSQQGAQSEMPETDMPLDGLADRGPWTANELAEIGDTDYSAGGYGGEGVAEAHDVPGEHGAAQGYDAAANSEEPEPDVPAEEPINRGLLLKFLSSVRN